MEKDLNKLFDINMSKAEIHASVAALLDEIDEGNVDPMEIFIFSHKLLEFATALHTNAKPHIQGTNGDFYGLRISEVKAGSTYDFSDCGSHHLNYLVDQQNKYKAAIEREQAFLKGLTHPLQVVDDDTGECYEIRPPVNRFSMVPKVEWL